MLELCSLCIETFHFVYILPSGYSGLLDFKKKRLFLTVDFFSMMSYNALKLGSKSRLVFFFLVDNDLLF